MRDSSGDTVDADATELQGPWLAPEPRLRLSPVLRLLPRIPVPRRNCPDYNESRWEDFSQIVRHIDTASPLIQVA